MHSLTSKLRFYNNHFKLFVIRPPPRWIHTIKSILLSEVVMSDYIEQAIDILTFGNYSSNTIKTYKTYLIPFLNYCDSTLHKDPADVTDSEVRSFILAIQKERKLSDTTVNLILSELCFLYEAVLDLSWNSKRIPHRKVPTYLPYVPTKETVQKFIACISDIKIKAMVVLMYSAGLRISEVCRLKCSDIQHDQHRIYVSPSKRNRDRYTILAEETYDLLKEYWRSLPDGMKTTDWLFTQQTNVEKPIYPQFIQKNIPKFEDALGWDHQLQCHSFRHAFATHSYMAGMSLETLALLLGHKDTRTTRIYIQLAMLSMEGVTSPISGMDLNHG